MLRSVVAVLGGFAAMALIVMAGTFALVAAFLPGGLSAMKRMREGSGATAMPAPTPPYLAMNITLSFIAALLGGVATTRIAARAPSAHLIALGAVIVVMGVASAFTPGNERQPSWYRFVIPVVGLAGVAASALLLRGPA